MVAAWVPSPIAISARLRAVRGVICSPAAPCHIPGSAIYSGPNYPYCHWKNCAPPRGAFGSVQPGGVTGFGAAQGAAFPPQTSLISSRCEVGETERLTSVIYGSSGGSFEARSHSGSARG